MGKLTEEQLQELERVIGKRSIAEVQEELYLAYCVRRVMYVNSDGKLSVRKDRFYYELDQIKENLILGKEDRIVLEKKREEFSQEMKDEFGHKADLWDYYIDFNFKNKSFTVYVYDIETNKKIYEKDFATLDEIVVERIVWEIDS